MSLTIKRKVWLIILVIFVLFNGISLLVDIQLNRLEKLQNELYEHSTNANLSASSLEEVENADNMFDEIKNETLKLLRTLSIITAVILVGILYFTIKGIIKPLAAASEFAEKISQGKLNIDKMVYNEKNEIGLLINSMNNMFDNVKGLIVTIQNNTDMLITSTKELSGSVAEVGETAEQVGVAIENVATGAEEQSLQIKKADENVHTLRNTIKNLENSSELSEATTSLMNTIGEGDKSVENSIAAINKVEEETIEVTKVIHQLNNSSEEIVNIVRLISGFAEQTKLLALNAAIEAARAGEAGRGFSVVADEIRELATESAEATDEISRIIQQVQSNLSLTVEKMNSSKNSVEEGVNVISKTGGIFNDIGKLADTLENVIKKVNRILIKMGKNSQTVEKQINNIAVVSQEFAGNSEEVAASSEEQIASTEGIVLSTEKLADMAVQLKNAANKFDT